MIIGAELSSLCGYSLPAQFKFVPKSTRGGIFVLEIGVEVKKRVLLAVLGLKKNRKCDACLGGSRGRGAGGRNVSTKVARGSDKLPGMDGTVEDSPVGRGCRAGLGGCGSSF